MEAMNNKDLDREYCPSLEVTTERVHHATWLLVSVPISHLIDTCLQQKCMWQVCCKSCENLKMVIITGIYNQSNVLGFPTSKQLSGIIPHFM